MEGGGLFNQAFLGGDFLWWIGQVVDDSTWRDNILSGKFKNPHSIKGWGRRYKVRIIGIHDQGITAIPDEELPWAQVMYPVTGGGGQANSVHTPNIRQGMMVFGFFLDGPDLQQPIIMGILGNNAQTELKTKIGDGEVTNEQPGSLATSGWAEREGGQPKGEAKDTVPDEAKTVISGAERNNKEAAIFGSGAVLKLDKYGLPVNVPRNKEQLKDIASGLAEVSKRDDLRKNMGLPALTKGQADNLVKDIVSSGLKSRIAQSQRPDAKRQKGATIEQVDGVHQTSAADKKREAKYQEKVVLMKPQDLVQSATTAIQTETDNLTTKLNSFLGAVGNYADAVSGAPTDMKSLIAGAACSNSKYMKIIMDQVMEFTGKTVNKELSKTVSSLPASKRYMFGDMKDIMTQNLLKQYNGITNNMCGLIEGILTKSLDVDNKLKEAQAIANNPLPVQKPNVGIETTSVAGNPVIEPTPTYPTVPICYAEDIIGQVLAANKEAIDNANDGVLNNLNAFVDDMKSEMREVEEKYNRPRDNSRIGAVVSLTDEEVLNLTRGGTGYITAQDVGTTIRSNVLPGVSTTTDGSGLTVDYTVTTGGAGDGYVTITAGGSGYTAGTNVATTGGSGNTDCTVNTTVVAGEVTAVSIAATGTGYKQGDDLTITGGGGNATFKIDTVVGAIDDGSIVINNPGSQYTNGTVITVNAGNDDATFTITQVLDPGTKTMDAPKSGVGAPQQMSSMLSKLGSMTSSLTSALNFKNITSNVFPFELPPSVALSDFYTLAGGGSANPDTQLPSMKGIADRAVGSLPDVVQEPAKDFLTPPKDSPSSSEDSEEGTLEMY